MVIESKRTTKGDENMYALDEDFPELNSLNIVKDRRRGTGGKQKKMLPKNISYHRRSKSKKSPWGDDIFPMKPSYEEVKAAKLLVQFFGVATLDQSIFTVQPNICPKILLNCLNRLSNSRFLSEPPSGMNKSNDDFTWSVVPWFQERGYSMLAHFIANKIEIILWRSFLFQNNIKKEDKVGIMVSESSLKSYWCDMSHSEAMKPKSFVQYKDKLEQMSTYVTDSTPCSMESTPLPDNRHECDSDFDVSSLDSILFVSFYKLNRLSLLKSLCTKLEEFRASHYEAKIIATLSNGTVDGSTRKMQTRRNHRNNNMTDLSAEETRDSTILHPSEGQLSQLVSSSSVSAASGGNK
eukprot:CAMPEP_0114385530 /NCGR_PEP_ID=MMETSP0102-20121206/6050_1 /TAXON_ID=38822 ORGANISM="Pteridomonas danica, Strain PT" /NCGR_SAMPLE_ID=MMETSP0102 /ASSEMBLY_ACC=CAM_ASM_000212 /LENGTH=350 /DNA_ID=CAMNT_0001542121 /DNA_START=148 /DNA_END=1197 /DNA_ORIENTATION=+